jgi:hypothetical protein
MVMPSTADYQGDFGLENLVRDQVFKVNFELQGKVL